MKITQQYFGLGIENPIEININQTRINFKSANKIKRISNKSFILYHGIKGRIQIKSIITIIK